MSLDINILQLASYHLISPETWLTSAGLPTASLFYQLVNEKIRIHSPSGTS